jgi:hypothetical protein
LPKQKNPFSGKGEVADINKNKIIITTTTIVIIITMMKIIMINNSLK